MKYNIKLSFWGERMGNLYCVTCGRMLDVVFSEEHKAFLSDKEYPVGSVLKGEGLTDWRVTKVEKHEMGWLHHVEPTQP